MAPRRLDWPLMNNSEEPSPTSGSREFRGLWGGCDQLAPPAGCGLFMPLPGALAGNPTGRPAVANQVWLCLATSYWTAGSNCVLTARGRLTLRVG